MLLDRHWVVGAPLYGRIVTNDDALAALDPANPGDDAGRRNFLPIHLECCKGRELQKWRARVNQRHDPVARQQFATLEVALARVRRPASGGLAPALVEFSNQPLHLRRIGAKLVSSRIDSREQTRHVLAPRRGGDGLHPATVPAGASELVMVG